MRHPHPIDCAGDWTVDGINWQDLVPTVSSSLLSVRASSITEMKWTSEILCLVFLVKLILYIFGVELTSPSPGHGPVQGPTKESNWL